MTDSLHNMSLSVVNFWWTIAQLESCFASSSSLGVLANQFSAIFGA